MRGRAWLLALCVAVVGPTGCQEELADQQATQHALPYAVELLDFSPGPGAGYGQERLPDIVLGPPQGHGALQGSLDVLSLGAGGSITLGFGGCEVVDGPGPDLLVFENPFWAAGDPQRVFAELGEVSVSQDGESWHSFACDPSPEGSWGGCAGWTPTQDFATDSLQTLDPEICGGDSFDLAQLGLDRALYLKIRDISGQGGAPSAGFDLDAVGLIHYACR